MFDVIDLVVCPLGKFALLAVVLAAGLGRAHADCFCSTLLHGVKCLVNSNANAIRIILNRAAL